MLETLLSFFRKPNSGAGNETPEGLCPNCWGTQEYDSQIRQLYEDKQVDVNNHTAHHAFIQQFVVDRVDGIQLKKDEDAFVCPTCSVRYKDKRGSR